MPGRKTVTLTLSRTNLKKLESQLLRDNGVAATTEQAIKYAVRHYPGLRNEVKKLKKIGKNQEKIESGCEEMEVRCLKLEVYYLRRMLRKIGRNQGKIGTACQEIYETVNKAQENTSASDWEWEAGKEDQEDFI